MIEIKNIEKTKLEIEPLLKTIQKFSNLEKNILIIFDGRLKCHGNYNYLSSQVHCIKISTTVFQFSDRIGKIYELIGTLLHELKHAIQEESLGTQVFESENFSTNKTIKSSATSDYFSLREVEARIFEESKLLAAVEFYRKNCSGFAKIKL